MRKISFLLILLLLLACSTAAASPKMAVISTYSSSSWLPTDINKKACAVVDDYLADHYFAAIFNSSKVQDKKDLAQHIAKTEDSNVVLIQLTAFYDPPYTRTHIISGVKTSDTVATVLMDYSVCLASSDRCITGRIVQRAVYNDAAVPLETAYKEAVRQSLPKLNETLSGII